MYLFTFPRCVFTGQFFLSVALSLIQFINTHEHRSCGLTDQAILFDLWVACCVFYYTKPRPTTTAHMRTRILSLSLSPSLSLSLSLHTVYLLHMLTGITQGRETTIICDVWCNERACVSECVLLTYVNE